LKIQIPEPILGEFSVSNKHHHFLDTIDECFTHAINYGIFHLSTEDKQLNGRTIKVKGRDVVNFGSCSYMGFEVDPRLKQGAIDAVEQYGTQFSSSRAYMSCGLYVELEHLFEQIFKAHVIMAPTTTLAHMSTIPVVVRDNDVVILDHQVHASVQTSVQLLKPRGVRVEMIRHNRIDQLEDLITQLKPKHDRIWYMADGVYSMYGDCAPFHELQQLLRQHDQFRLYIDDAHGMSWIGEHGAGYAMHRMPLHPHMILITSLAKGFGTGGGAIVNIDKNIHRLIRTCGNTLIFSGPIQPPTLGASIASAKIHLSDEMPLLQQQLQQKVKLCNQRLGEYRLPLLSENSTPLFYIGVGLLRVSYNLIHRLLEEGYYVNVGIFPAVPIKCSGVRFTINRNLTTADIDGMTQAMAHHFPLAFKEESRDYEDITQSFKVPVTLQALTQNKSSLYQQFKVEHYYSIYEVSKSEWDKLLGHEGSFDWEGLKFLEKTFAQQKEPENNWKFHYFIIRDQHNHPVLATFFTELLIKDDMLSPASVSEKIEILRNKDPYYLTSKVLMMGSLLTEGQHLYLDKQHKDWKDALLLLLDLATETQEKAQAVGIQLRDFNADDEALRKFFLDQGFIRVRMPDAHVIKNLNWETQEEYYQSLSHNSKKHIRKYVFRYSDNFRISITNKPSVSHFYDLYKNVKQKNLELNTFNLPKNIFERMTDHGQWEFIEIFLKNNEVEKNEIFPVAAGACYITEKNYCPMIVGLDYKATAEYECYRQMLFQVVLRARALNKEKIYFGMGASIEKQKFGAIPLKKVAYLQMKDNYHMEVISTVKDDG